MFEYPNPGETTKTLKEQAEKVKGCPFSPFREVYRIQAEKDFRFEMVFLDNVYLAAKKGLRYIWDKSETAWLNLRRIRNQRYCNDPNLYGRRYRTEHWLISNGVLLGALIFEHSNGIAMLKAKLESIRYKLTARKTGFHPDGKTKGIKQWLINCLLSLNIQTIALIQWYKYNYLKPKMVTINGRDYVLADKHQYGTSQYTIDGNFSEPKWRVTGSPGVVGFNQHVGILDDAASFDKPPRHPSEVHIDLARGKDKGIVTPVYNPDFEIGKCYKCRKPVPDNNVICSDCHDGFTPRTEVTKIKPADFTDEEIEEHNCIEKKLWNRSTERCQCPNCRREREKE